MQDLQQTVEESRSSRGAFLRRFGTTLAIGLGVGLVPATNAWACTTRCCPADNATCGLPPSYSCGNGLVLKRCTDCCPTCCACFSTGGCESHTGGQCPC
jgi:hypothetical protein